MTPELWDRLKPLFEAVVEKPASDREAFIATLDADDELRHELHELVKAHETSGSTLDSVQRGLQAMVPITLSAHQPGDVLLGRFRIVRWLGNGGMGDVYEAVDRELSETVALKAIRPSIAGSPQILARFKKEVHLARQLTGANLCRIHELFVSGQDGHDVFLTMELLDGITLAEEIKNNGPLPWAKARAIVTDLCVALASMHDAGIIHRDVKTRNVMLSTRNRATHPVLMDFGLAHEVVSPDLQSETVLSLPGILMGTPPCMAPEQFSGGELTPATDIYAMGVVLYEMVTGKAPFPATDTVRAAIQRGKPPVPASKLRPELPHGLDKVIARCLAFEPPRRYQSVNDLAHDVQRISGRFSNLADRISVSATTLKWVLAVLATILLTAGLARWWFVSRPSAPPDPRAVSWYEQGLSALREGTYLQAAGEFQQAVKLDGGFVAAHARLAEAWAELDFTGSAEHELLVALQQAQAKTLLTLDRKYLDAIHATLTHDLAGAIRQQQAILQALPEDQKGFGYLDLGRAQEKNNDIAGAVKSYETAASLQQDSPAAFVHLGVLKGRQEDTPGAEAAFNRAEELYKLKQNIEGLAEVAFQRAHWANEQADSGKAAMWLDTCAQIARELPSVQLEVRTLSQLSNVEYASGQIDKSIEDAGQVIQLARENNLEYWVADGLIRQGNAYLVKRDFNAAEGVTEQALKLAEQHQHGNLTAKAHFTLASIRDQQGKLNEQIQHARAALNFFTGSGFQAAVAQTEVLLVRGQIGMGESVEALQTATNLLEVSKKLGSPAQLETAEETMGDILLELQRYPEALVHFREALRLSRITGQGIANYLLNCADTLWRLGRYSETDVMLQTIPKSASQQSDIAAGTSIVRALTLLSQRRFRNALAIATGVRRQFPNDLTPSDLMDLGYVITMANLQTGHLDEAQKESRNLADLAKRENTAPLVGISNYLLAVTDLRTGSTARARDEAQAAQAYFSASQEFESEWRSLMCIAEAAKAEGDRSTATQYAGKALDALEKWQQSWDAASRQTYAGRPDTRISVTRMRSLLAAG